ncbi:MAG: SDR family oxidoreductase [Actinomycetota bacterium]|nr:SDR family oxidoreductase [Actinomycetota bacterium]
MSPTVLLTGATGFLGMEVLARLLEREDVEVLALVRGSDDDEAQARLDGVLSTLYESPSPEMSKRARAVRGDATSEGLGLSDADRQEVVSRVDGVLHCAASISFDLPLAEAREINTEGTRRVLEVAHEISSLRRFVHVSTAYVSGDYEGCFRESDLDVGQGFRNTYEQSKYETEVMLAEQAGDLPLAIARPSIVVGEAATGWTPTFNVIYWPLQAFSRGLFDRVPATADGRVDIVPVDYVADALVHLLDHEEICETVHLVAGDEAVTNTKLIELASELLGRPQPELMDPSESLDLEEASIYLPYFNVRAEFDDSRAREIFRPHGFGPTPLADYFGPLIEYAVNTRWGRRPVTREAAAAALERPVA